MTALISTGVAVCAPPPFVCRTTRARAKASIIACFIELPFSFALDALHHDVSVLVDEHVEHERPTADRTILDEALPPPCRGVDTDGVLLIAGRADVEPIGLNRHVGPRVPGSLGC